MHSCQSLRSTTPEYGIAVPYRAAEIPARLAQPIGPEAVDSPVDPEIADRPTSHRSRPWNCPVTYKLMSLATIQIARLLGLVRGIQILKFEGAERPSWGVLVRGRGFDRLLQDDILIAPALIRPMSAYSPRPRVFFSAGHATRFIQRMGLAPLGWARTPGRRR